MTTSPCDPVTGQGVLPWSDTVPLRPERRNGWYESRRPGGYVTARQWPPRLDVAASGVFPPANHRRLALQVRQDLWRVLKLLRGFSPVIEVCALDEGLRLTAGGRIDGSIPPMVERRVSALLNSPAHRARWLSWATEQAA